MLASLPDPNMRTVDVMDALRASNAPLQEWGKAIDGTPLIAARVGGSKQPGIFITAGCHCDETAGVHAALALVHMLRTEHTVHILPLRDPFGFAGASHCLSWAAGEQVEAANHDEALDYLRSRGELLWQGGHQYLFRLGEIGFMWSPPAPGLESHWAAQSAMGSLVRDHPHLLTPLRGKSIMFLQRLVGVEGSERADRCFHGVLSARGEWLHLNRFFGRQDAPSEVAAIDRLMQTVQPGLTCDLHEGNGEGFWMPIPRPAEDSERVFRMARAYFEYIESQGYPVTTYENWRATDHTASAADWMRPEPRLQGLFWVFTPLRGEGPNLMDYAMQYGTAFGTEGPMERPLAMRVDGIANGIMAALKVWEQGV
jgi:hypothetical protein